MKKSITIIVLVLTYSLSFASGGNKYSNLDDRNERKIVINKNNGVTLEHGALVPGKHTNGALKSTNTIIYNNPDGKGEDTWVSKTFRTFGSGLDLAGFNIKMNSFDLVKNTGWTHQKENQLNPDVTHNGLRLRFKF